jgi:hypothetical protein
MCQAFARAVKEAQTPAAIANLSFGGRAQGYTQPPPLHCMQAVLSGHDLQLGHEWISPAHQLIEPGLRVAVSMAVQQPVPSH